jgi:subfamily B ATP-binding cassette protein MsbA
MLFFLPIKKLAGVHILFEQASVGVHRLANILREQPVVREPAQPRPLKQFRAAIRFDDVTFAYEPGRPVLRDFTLTIPRGVKVGVAGASGSGKTTLVNLLFRFYDPTHGAITIDGVDVREVSFRDLRCLLALVSQDVVVFDQTVAENIALGRPGASREDIERAARDAFAHEFIQQLPQGYDTRVGERGVTLSGGQRQRIAIARAFIRNAPILVLDEATASLDSEAEAEVQAAIDRLEQHRTVLCVAHRLSTLASMDALIVLDQGRIIERGTFADLLAAGGPFAAMAARQGLVAARSR